MKPLIYLCLITLGITFRCQPCLSATASLWLTAVYGFIRPAKIQRLHNVMHFQRSFIRHLSFWFRFSAFLLWHRPFSFTHQGDSLEIDPKSSVHVFSGRSGFCFPIGLDYNTIFIHLSSSALSTLPFPFLFRLLTLTLLDTVVLCHCFVFYHDLKRSSWL